MRVISQDGKYDLPYENIIIHISENRFIVANWGHGIPCVVAEYSTTEKAEKAMQKLHNKYSYLWRAEHGLVSYFADETTAFRFPQEDEI